MSSSFSTDPATHDDFLRESEQVQRLVYGIVGNTAVADDILQEAWVRALERPPRHTAAVGGWFARVARNLAVDWFRKENRLAGRKEHTEPDVVGVDASPEGVAARTETSHMLLHAVGNLSDPYRTVITLHYLEGFTVSEVARETGVPTSTVRTQLMRGRERLETALNQNMGSQWQARLIAMFPMIQPLLGPVGPSAAISGSTALSSKTAVQAWAAIGTLAVLIGSAWVWFGGEKEVPPSMEAGVTTSHPTSQASFAGLGGRLADPSLDVAGDDSGLAMPIIDPEGLIQGPVQAQAIQLGQGFRGAAQDSPLGALVVLGNPVPLTVLDGEIQIPSTIRGLNWMLELQADGVATERMGLRDFVELEKGWQPKPARKIKLQVSDRGVAGIEGAYVFIGCKDLRSIHPVQWKISGADGWVEFEGLPEDKLRCLAFHPNGGVTSATEAQIKQYSGAQFSKSIDHGIVPIWLGAEAARDLTAEKLFSFVFPYGSGAAKFNGFVQAATSFIMRQNHLRVPLIDGDSDPKDHPYLLTGQVTAWGGGPARDAIVLVEFADGTHGRGQLGENGMLKIRAGKAITRLAIIAADSFVRVDELIPEVDEPKTVDVGVLVMKALPTASVEVMVEEAPEELNGGLTEVVHAEPWSAGPSLPLADWPTALLQSSQWLEPRRTAPNTIQFRAPGADLLGRAWVQVESGFAHYVSLKPNKVVQLELPKRCNLRIQAAAPFAKPGTPMVLQRNRRSDGFTGLRPDGSPKRIVAYVQEDGRTVEFFDIPHGSYSLDTYPVYLEAFTMETFMVHPGDNLITIDVPQSGTMRLELPNEWLGDGWYQVRHVDAVGTSASQSTNRRHFGWNSEIEMDLKPGQYELTVQFAGGLPVLIPFTILEGNTHTIRPEVLLSHIPLRIEAVAGRDVKRVVVILRGADHAKWFRQRASYPAPTGGFVVTNGTLKYPSRAGWIRDCGIDATVDLKNAPQDTVHVMALDQHGIWSHPVAVTVDRFKPGKTTIVHPKWPTALVLEHPPHWGKWRNVSVAGFKLLDQRLRLLKDETPLTLSEGGDVELRFTYIDAHGNSVEVNEMVQVDPLNPLPRYFPIPIPD